MSRITDIIYAIGESICRPCSACPLQMSRVMVFKCTVTLREASVESSGEVGAEHPLELQLHRSGPRTLGRPQPPARPSIRSD